MSVTLENFRKNYMAYLKTVSGKNVTLQYAEYQDNVLMEVSEVRQGEVKNYKEFLINVVWNSTSGGYDSNQSSAFTLYDALNQYYLHTINTGLSTEMNIISEVLNNFMFYKHEDTEEFTSPVSLRIWVR